jgi:hypothetical protein
MLEQSDDFHFEECKKVESHGRNNDKNYKVSYFDKLFDFI